MKSEKRNIYKKAIIGALQSGNSVVSACEQLKITRKTFYEWLHKDKEFLSQYEEAIKSRCRVLEDAMFETAIGGNATMQIFLSCNWMPEKYHSIMKVDHTGKVGLGIEFVEIKKNA